MAVQSWGITAEGSQLRDHRWEGSLVALRAGMHAWAQLGDHSWGITAGESQLGDHS